MQRADSPGVQVARQPIFDRSLDVAAYELLYRAHTGSTDAASTDSESTMEVVSAALFSLGTDRLTGDKVGFVSFTRDLLLAEVIRAALLGEGGDTVPGAAMALTHAYERGEWDVSSAIADRLGLTETAISSAYLEGVDLSRALIAA